MTGIGIGNVSWKSIMQNAVYVRKCRKTEWETKRNKRNTYTSCKFLESNHVNECSRKKFRQALLIYKNLPKRSNHKCIEKDCCPRPRFHDIPLVALATRNTKFPVTFFSGVTDQNNTVRKKKTKLFTSIRSWPVDSGPDKSGRKARHLWGPVIATIVMLNLNTHVNKQDRIPNIKYGGRWFFSPY